MPSDTTIAAGDHPSPIEIDLRPAGSRYAAIVALCGEHDIATAPEVRQALERISGSVLVDLTRCEFIDSSAIGVLISASKTRARDGGSLELVVPPENTTIARTLHVAGVGDLLTVHPARPAGRDGG